jgi:SSS family solute:Na+ symporter
MPGIVLFAASEKALISIGPLDYAIIAIYFVVVLGIGIYLKRFAGTGEDFFMAGRKMTAWIAGLSFISANLSSLETMGWSANAYQYGMLGAHAYLIGAIPAILFLAIVMMPFYYICKTHSVPGYLALRYDQRAASVAGISFAFMTVLVSGASMFAMAKILHLLLDWDMNMSIWVASITVAIYVTLGGLVSAVLNEVLQFFLIWFGSLLIPILGLVHAGGWHKMMATVQEHVPAIHPTVKNADFGHLWSNLGTFQGNPMGIDWFGMVFGLGLAVSFGYWCTDFLQVQRVLVAKDLRAAQNGTIIGAALKMCVPLIVTVPGLLGLAVLMNSDGTPLVLVPESDPRANITNHTFNDVLPLLMGQYLGPGLLGLGVTAMIAGFMSGMAGNVSAFATVWTYDVYRPLLNRKASDRHYLTMGRWASLLGVLISIGTAYALFYFSNIIAFLQVLVFFFIVPLFGVVLLGMLWKRCTPTAGFVGFSAAILFSICMWFFVHTFPGGYQAQPKIALAEGTTVSLETGTVDGRQEISKVLVLSGTASTTNVHVGEPGAKGPLSNGEFTIKDAELALPATAEALHTATGEETGPAVPVGILAPKVLVVQSPEKKPEESKFGIKGVPVVLQPGVQVKVSNATHYFVPAAFNPAHVKLIAFYDQAKEMAVNMYCAFWTLVLCVAVTVGVSLCTRPKPEAELKDLVMGLTPLPDEGPCPWYKHPLLWAAVVAAVLIGINIYFW